MMRPSNSAWSFEVQAAGPGVDTFVVDFPVYGMGLQWLNLLWWSPANARAYHAHPEAFWLLKGGGGFLEAVPRRVYTGRADGVPLETRPATYAEKWN